MQGILEEQIKVLLEQFKKDPITMVWVDKHQESELHKQFGESKYHLVAYKPKRARYLGYRNADFSPESIGSFIADVLGGSGEWSKFEGEELKLSGLTINSRDDL